MLGVGEGDAEGVRDVEAVAVADEHTLLIKQIVAELFGRHIKVIMDEVSRTVGFCILVYNYLHQKGRLHL